MFSTAKTFPAFPENRVREQCVVIRNAEQLVQDARIPDVEAGRLDEPFFHVRVPGLHPPDQQQVDEDVQAVRDGLAVDFQVAAQFRVVHGGALEVSQHGPKPPQPGCGNPESEGCGIVPVPGRFGPASPAISCFRNPKIPGNCTGIRLSTIADGSPLAWNGGVSKRFRPFISM